MLLVLPKDTSTCGKFFEIVYRNYYLSLYRKALKSISLQDGCIVSNVCKDINIPRKLHMFSCNIYRTCDTFALGKRGPDV